MGMREDFEKWADANWMIVHSPDDAWECWQAATLQAAERMKEEAAKKRAGKPRELKPCGTGALQYCFDKGHKEGAKAVRAAISAIDVNKLFGE